MTMVAATARSKRVSGPPGRAAGRRPSIKRGWLSEAERAELLAWAAREGSRFEQSEFEKASGRHVRRLDESPEVWPGWFVDRLAAVTPPGMCPVPQVVVYGRGGFIGPHNDRMWIPVAGGDVFPLPDWSLSCPLTQDGRDRDVFVLGGEAVELDAGDLIGFDSSSEHEIRPTNGPRAALVVFCFTAPWPQRKRRCTVVSGPAGAGKSTHLWRAWNTAKGRPAAVVLPALVSSRVDGAMLWPPGNEDALLVADEAGQALGGADFDRYVDLLGSRSRGHELVIATHEPSLFREWAPRQVELPPAAVQDSAAPEPAQALALMYPTAGMLLLHPLALFCWARWGIDDAAVARYSTQVEPVAITDRAVAAWMWQTTAALKGRPGLEYATPTP